MIAGSAPRSLRDRGRQLLGRWRHWAGVPGVLSLLLAVHVGFGLVRFPVGAIQKRLESVRDWRERGPDGWSFRMTDAETQRVARWLREQVRPEHLVRVAGDPRGSLQLLAPVVFPALLVAEGKPGEWPAGRPVFGSHAPWLAAPAGATPVVVATPSTLRVEYR